MADSETQTRTKADEKALSLGYTFDASAADRVKRFISQFCRQSKGEFAGKPIQLLPWQDNLVTQLYGWKRPDGTRRYRQCGVWVAKKNGKSTLASALCLYHLLADQEPGAEVYCIANDIQQAGIVFSEAANMVAQSPLLHKKLEIVKSTKRINYDGTKSIYRALSSEKAGKHGYNASFLLFDEIGHCDDRELWDILRYATAMRKQPLTITISTASYRREGIGYEQYQYAKGVAEGKIDDPHFLPIIFEADPDGDFRDPNQWRKANPSLGVTIPETDLAEGAKEAETEPRKESNFRTLRLNQWVGAADQWISTPAWDACGDAFDPAILDGRPCYVGLDLARRGDLASYVLLFNLDGLYYLLPRFYIPKDCAERKEQVDHVPYRLWERQGLLTMTDGDVIDYSFIRAALQKDKERYDIRELGFDPYNATMLVQVLKDEDGINCVEIKQTFAQLAPATAMFERLLRDKKIRHGGNAVLRWQAGNVVTRQDHQDNIIIDKARSTARIDGIASAVMALSRQMAAPPEMDYWRNPSIWG